MWIQEAFTDYSETLFVEYYYGKQAANEYCQGLRRNIENDAPIIGPYGVNKEGSGDMYFKGANIIHMIRQVINNDDKFRQILRGLNKDFYHQSVTTKQVEDYISQKSGIDFSKVFDQYLRTKQIPTFEISKDGYRWTTCIEGFNMPLRLKNGNWISPSTTWKKFKGDETKGGIDVDANFYIKVKKS